MFLPVPASTVGPPLSVCLLLLLSTVPAHAGDPSEADREEAAKVLIRPVCADPAAREKIVGQMIAQGGEYEQATAKWDLDTACEQIDLPIKPVHDTADMADGASHKNWLYDARWSGDGKLIVTASADGTVRLWDVATGKMLRAIDVSKHLQTPKPSGTQLPQAFPPAEDETKTRVRAARFVGDGKSIVVAADKQPVRMFSVESGEPVAEIPYKHPDPTWDMPPNIETTPGGLVVLGGYGGELVVYDTKTKAERYRLPGIDRDYLQFAVSEAAGLLATTAPGPNRSVMIQLRKLENGQKFWEAEAKGDTSAYAMAFSRDGKQLAAAVHGNAFIYDTGSQNLVGTILVYPTFGSFEVAFTPDGKRLIAGSRHAQLWDIATGKRLLHYGPFSDLCHSLDVSPDGKYLATSHMGSDGRIWDVETGTFFRRLGKNVHPPG